MKWRSERRIHTFDSYVIISPLEENYLFLVFDKFKNDHKGEWTDLNATSMPDVFDVHSV